MDPTADSPAASGRSRWLMLVLLLLFAGLGVQYAAKVLDPRGGRSAIVRWRNQLQDLEGGEDIYLRHGYPNPPVMALLLYPVSELPPAAGAMLLFALKAGMTLAVFGWVFRLVQGQGTPFPNWARVLAVALSLRPIVGDLSHGNVNLVILFLVVAALHLFRRGRDAAGGLVLALAVCCKVTPALFLPYLVWKRAWRALAGALVGLVLFGVAVPAAVLGGGRHAQLLSSWAGQMVTPYVAGGFVTTLHQNQSLPGLVHRLLTESPSFLDYDDGGPPRPTFHNVADLDPAAARRVVQGAALAFVLVVVVCCRTPWRAGGGWRRAGEFAVISLGMLLFSERTWKHHAVTLVLPLAVLCYALAAVRLTAWARGGVAAALALAAGLMATTSTSLLAPLGEGAAKAAQAWGGCTAGYLVLLGTLAVLLLRRREAGEDQPAVAREAPVRVLFGRIAVGCDPVAGRGRARPPLPPRLPPLPPLPR